MPFIKENLKPFNLFLLNVYYSEESKCLVICLFFLQEDNGFRIHSNLACNHLRIQEDLQADLQPILDNLLRILSNLVFQEVIQDNLVIHNSLAIQEAAIHNNLVIQEVIQDSLAIQEAIHNNLAIQGVIRDNLVFQEVILEEGTDRILSNHLVETYGGLSLVCPPQLT